MDNQYKLVGRAYNPNRDANKGHDDDTEEDIVYPDDLHSVYLAFTSDGSRTISLFNGRVTIYSNTSIDESGCLHKIKEHLLPDHYSNNHKDNGIHLFDNDTKIVFDNYSTLNVLDLETGHQIISPNLNVKLYGPFKFYENTTLTLSNVNRTLTRVKPVFDGLPKFENAKWAFCHDMSGCGPEDYNALALEYIDINQHDYSTIVVYDAYYRIILYDIRKFALDPSGQLEASLGKVDELGHVQLGEDIEATYIKFSPNGKRFAVILTNFKIGPDYESTSLSVFDANETLAETKGPSLKGNPICWYNDDSICFVESGKIVCWNINDNKKTELCPAFDTGVYVDPSLPFVANHKLNGRGRRAPIIELWSR